MQRRPKRDRESSCWTCRLRHKRCDAVTPVCGGCSALNIDCHYSHLKPDWMDNGPQQRDAARRITDSIKQNTKKRRSHNRALKLVRLLDANPSSYPTTDALGLDPEATSRARQVSGDRPGPGFDGESTREQTARPRVSLLSDDRVTISSRSTIDAPATAAEETPSAPSVGDSSLRSRSELDISSAMSYLDHVFPTLFPAYQPPILDGGRSWLLVLLVRSRAFLSTVISLVSYFFSTVPIGPEPSRLICTEMTWETLQKQMDDSMVALQSDLGELGQQITRESILPRVHILASMLHLLKLEVLIGSSDNWKLHLDAAVELFKQMVEKFDDNEYVSPLVAIQSQMSDLPDAARPPNSMGSYSNACQASFRFSAAILLYNDIISSTVLGQSPRLRRYHADLLEGKKSKTPSGIIRLEEFVGCQNWVLLQVGAVASLAAWKQHMPDIGTFEQQQLWERAFPIEMALRQGLAKDEAQLPVSPETRQTGEASNGIFSQGVAPGSDLHISRIITTRIWAYTARMYLFVVAQGWDCDQPSIRECVAETIALFQKIESASWMASLAWPFCVSACLATVEDRPVFRTLATSLRGLKHLGIMRDALGIAEKVWRDSDSGDVSSLDVKTCLGCLGHRALLV